MFKFAVIAFCLLTSRLLAADVQVPVYYDSLKNGLKIIIVPDTTVAVVSCRLYYFAGSMYEGPGSSGLAHLYEHMMFKGTSRLGTTDYKKELPLIRQLDSLDTKLALLMQNGAADSDTAVTSLQKQQSSLLETQRKYIKKDEIWDLYQNSGATNLNAWTADDMTAYIVTLPQNKVELFYWIESDRMRDPVLREFQSELKVVREERRMRYDNIPTNRYWERLSEIFYLSHPYRTPTIGWMSDLRTYTRAKLQNYVQHYYTPDNAVVVMVGNINPAQARVQIERYFGAIARAPIAKTEVTTREDAPIGETRFTMYEKTEGRIDMLFHTPGYPNTDLYMLDIIEDMLSGRSGRLYNRLVVREKLCTDAGASNAIRLHDGYFQIWASLKKSADPALVEKIMLDEIEKIRTKPPLPTEMERARNNIRMSFVSRIKDLESLSDELAWFERLGGYKNMFEYSSHIAAVKADSMPAVALKTFNPLLKTIGILLPNTK